MSQLVTVPFHEDTLFAVEDGGIVYVALKPICDALGVSPDRQRDRVRRDPVLSEGATMVGVPSTGGMQETFCLRLDLLQGWLFGIEAGRVKPEARDRVLAYKRECCAVLFRHFYAERVTVARPAAGHGESNQPAPRHREPADPTASRRRLVAEARKTFGPRAAGELWRALGLPTVPAMADPPAQGELGFTYTAVRQDTAPAVPAAR